MNGSILKLFRKKGVMLKEIIFCLSRGITFWHIIWLINKIGLDTEQVNANTAGVDATDDNESVNKK